MTTAADYVRPEYLDRLELLTARQLWHELRRSEGPAAIGDAIRAELATRRAGAGSVNRARAEMYARAEFYAWHARRGFAEIGNDPIGGRPWDRVPGTLPRELGRATGIAAARVCYRRARGFQSPFARLEEVRNALLPV